MRKKELLILVIALLILGGILACLPLLLRGQTVVTEGTPEVEKTDAVTCVAEGLQYPYLEPKLDEIGWKLQIDMKFDEGEVELVGLRYDTQYASEERAEEAYQMLTPELNASMEKNGLDSRMMNNVRLAKSKTHVTLTIFATKDDLTAESAKYLMLNDRIDFNKSALVDNYNKVGLKCS